jgi:hypothetical protein
MIAPQVITLIIVPCGLIIVRSKQNCTASKFINPYGLECVDYNSYDAGSWA